MGAGFIALFIFTLNFEQHLRVQRDVYPCLHYSRVQVADGISLLIHVQVAQQFLQVDSDFVSKIW